MSLQILIADDHNLLREALRPFLEKLDAEVGIVEASNFDETFNQAQAADRLDMILLDLNMPGMNGTKSIEQLSAEVSGVPIVMMSGQFGRKDVMSAIEAGASGYIPKTLSGDAMVNALRLVLSGETYVPSVAFSDVEEVGDDKSGTSSNGPLALLSKRETEIIGLLIEGNTNKEIARELDLQEITIKIHLRNAYKKIGASNRADAVRIAFQNGWESPS